MTFFQLANTSEGLWPFSGQSHIPGPIAARRRSNHTCRVTSVGEWRISCCSLSTSSWGLWHLTFVNFRFLRCKCRKGPILSAQSSFQPTPHPEDPSPSLLPLGSVQSLLWDNEQLSPFCLALCLHPWLFYKLNYFENRMICFQNIFWYFDIPKCSEMVTAFKNLPHQSSVRGKSTQNALSAFPGLSPVWPATRGVTYRITVL